MAKRRRLEAPSAEELSEMETGFARETAPPVRPPIAQVAGDAAASSPMVPAADRAAAARDRADAGRLRQAETEGLLVLEIPLHDILAEELTRDRLRADGEEMDELRRSIQSSGLRLPIEVFRREGPGETFGLISGWRRLSAVRALHAETGDPRFATIRALIRQPADVPSAYVAMVEENEIRSDLSHYERGRIAVLAAGQGAFASVEQAVDALFPTASKAKRSKIRSFALIHEELGDLLAFGSVLGERAGLRLAQSLRAGFAGRLRQALATGQGTSAPGEWAILEPLVKRSEGKASDPARGGRPSRQTRGVQVEAVRDEQGFAIRLHGAAVNEALLGRLVAELRKMLG